MSFGFSISSRPSQRRRDLIGPDRVAHFRQVPVVVMIGHIAKPNDAEAEAGISLTAHWMSVIVNLVFVNGSVSSLWQDSLPVACWLFSLADVLPSETL